MKSAGNLSVFKTYLTCFTLRHILRANCVVRDSTSLNKNKLSEFNYRYKPKSMTVIVRRTNTFILKSDVSLKYKNNIQKYMYMVDRFGQQFNTNDFYN